MSQILVTAATGNVGAPLVNALQQKNMDFTAATRNAERAREKLGPSVDTVFLDYEDSGSFGPALEGHDLLFLCGPSGTPNAGELIMPIVDEARKQDIKHIVFVASHPDVADAIEASGIEYTFLKANFFMQNFEMYQTEDLRDHRQIFLPTGDGEASFIHTRDIGETAAEILAGPSEYQRETLPITGPEALDLYEAAGIFSDVLGTDITYRNPDDETYRSELENRGRPEAYIQAMIDVFGKIKKGNASATSPVVEQVLGRTPLSLKDYAKEKQEHFRSR